MSFLKRSGIYLTSNMLNALVPFLLLPVLTRYLTPGEYGQIAMFQTLVTGLAALVGLNTVGAANRKYFDNEPRAYARYNGACLQILFSSALIICLICFLLSTRISEWLSIPVSWVYLAVIIASGNFLIQIRLGQWQVREEATRFGIMQVSQSVLVFLLSLLLVVTWNNGASGRIDALLTTTIVYAVLSVFLLYKDNLVKVFSYNKVFIKDALAFGVPLVPHVVGIFFLSSVDRFFITKNLGISEAGIYMLAVQLSLGVAVVFDALNKALVTWLFKSLADNNIHQLQRVVKLTYLFFMIVIFLGVLSFWVGPWVVTIVAGQAYQQSGQVIGWLCLGQAFGGMYLMVTNYIFYAKKTGALSVVTISTGILNILLLLWLIQTKGIIGAGMAFAISMFFRFIGTWLIAINVSSFSWQIPLFKKCRNN